MKVREIKQGMKAKFLFIFLLGILLSYRSFSQDTLKYYTYHGKKTIFDSFLLEKKGLTCLQYYNKLMSDFYRRDNYQGDPNKYSMALDAIFSKKTPFITVNGRRLDFFEFDEIMKFKKIISVEISPPLKNAKKRWRGDFERFGHIAFKAEK